MATKLQRSFLLGRTMGEAVKAERELVVTQLLTLGLSAAAKATRENCSFNDYFRMRGLMLAGGLHAVRLRGGRSINRR